MHDSDSTSAETLSGTAKPLLPTDRLVSWLGSVPWVNPTAHELSLLSTADGSWLMARGSWLMGPSQQSPPICQSLSNTRSHDVLDHGQRIVPARERLSPFDAPFACPSPSQATPLSLPTIERG